MVILRMHEDGNPNDKDRIYENFLKMRGGVI
jgi:hypothetical protein